MVVFFVKRLLMSLLVVLVSTLIMYVLVDIAIDPLADLRTSTAPNKAQQIANRTAELRLDDPVILRYLDWLKGASGCLYGSCDLGENWQTNQAVTSLLSGAVRVASPVSAARSAAPPPASPPRTRSRFGVVSAPSAAGICMPARSSSR